MALYVHKDIKCSKCITKSLTENGIFECVTAELAIPNKKNIIVIIIIIRQPLCPVVGRRPQHVVSK